MWVPVGNVYYSETEYKTITLGRYSNFTANDVGEYIPKQLAKEYSRATSISGYTEDTEANYTNKIALSIGDFVTSATTKGGYYIGRYEAGKENNTLVCKADQTVYDRVQQAEASNLSRNMYKGERAFSSDLVNSYAWDTAIVFIQTFSKEADASNYANLNKGGTSFANTGINNNKYCNIHDMSGNAWEWSTETASVESGRCCCRGAGAKTGWGNTSTRRCLSHNNVDIALSFRPILYVAL